MRAGRFGGAAGLFLLALAVFGGPGAAALGKKEAPQAQGGGENLPRFLGELTVTGRVRLVGNVPFSRRIISDDENRDWYVGGEDEKKLTALEQRNVRVRGKAYAQDMILADGEKAGVRYSLRDIEVLE